MNQKELEHKAKIYAARIILLPFVRMVVLTGSVATGKATQTSDIDFLIVTKPGRIYLARALVVLYVFACGQYRTKNKVAGKICLNWFMTDDLIFDLNALKIEFKLKIKDFKLNKDKVGKVTLLEKRDRENMPDILLSGKLGSILERWAKYYQIKRFQKDPRTHVKGSNVRWSDDEIGLHPPKM